MTTEAKEPPDDFEVAKAVFQQVRELPQERQERVLRWVAEGLGIVPDTTDRIESSAGPTGSRPALEARPPAPGTAQAPTDIRSFVAIKRPGSDQQFAAVVAYYYRFEAPPAQRRESINPETLQEAARLAGRKRPSSPLVTLNNAKKAGYLDSTTRGEFSISTVGENLVAMTLPSEGAASSKPVTSARRLAAKGTGRKKPKRG